MNIAEIRFTAKPGASCRGCLCEDARMVTCYAFIARALACGLPVCDPGNGEDSTHIYVAVDDLVGMVEQGELQS